jgi:flagellar basal-body rod modification protein FlgD
MNDIDKNGVNTFEGLGLTNPAAKKAEGKGNDLGQEQFLELMITQLKNQNPLKPMENGEFLGQMAQFGTVSGIQELQGSVNSLANALQSNQALQASALVGRAVLTPGGEGILEEGGTVKGAIDLPQSTTALTLKITDSSGQLVRRLELGPQASGPVQFSWDGLTDGGQPAGAGKYRVAAEAMFDGALTAVDAQVATKVESVSLGRDGQGIVLNLAGLGSVPLSEVNEIL